MSRNNSTTRLRGFTLIEMLIIAPVALLVITGFVALMVTMVGDVIAGRAHNVMSYDIQSALNTIEQDVRLSTQFLTTSGTMISPQGKNGATSAFTSSSGDLILGEIATNKNPIDPTRSFVYYQNAPFGCGNPAEIYKNRIFFMTVIYFVRDGSLWRRTYVPAAGGTLCSQPWQVNTCAPGYASGATQCQTNDSEILKGVDSFSVSYYTNPHDTVAISPASATSAQSINVTIEGEVTAAGRTVTASNSSRSTKLSSLDISQPVPGSPIVTGSTSGNEAVFSWPSAPNASSYVIQYNVNGGSWITASENSPDTSFSVPAFRGDTVSVKVAARNTTGTSPDSPSSNASVTLPIWTACSLQNGWSNYGGAYETCGYTITRSGVVILKGMIGGGTLSNGTNLFQLPADLRPAHHLFFPVAIATNKYGRIIINKNGNVEVNTIESGATNSYITISGTAFIPSGSLYKWNTLTPINGWSNYGADHPPLQSTVDDSGRVHTQGLLNRNSAPLYSDFTNMTSGTAPNKVHYFPGFNNNGYDIVGMRPNGTMMDRGISSTWYSVETIHYPASYGGWQTFTSVAGTPGDGQLGNGWVYFNDSGSIHENPQYTKGADGMVTVKGMIKSGSTSNGISIGRLPAGYRPAAQEMFYLTSAAGMARVEVYPNGYLIVRLVSSSWTSLDGIHFLAAP